MDQFCSDIRIFLNMIDDSFADIRGEEDPNALFGGRYKAISFPVCAFERWIYTGMGNSVECFNYRESSTNQVRDIFNNLESYLDNCALDRVK